MPDASLVLQRYRVFFLAFLKLHFPKINTTYRADVTTKQTTHAFLGITMRCAGFLAPFHRGDRRRNRKYNSVHSQHIYQD